MKPSNRIRSIALAVFTTALFSFQTAQAKDSCETLLCMAGMLNGNGVDASCKSAVDDYFKIVTKKKGKFSASRTARDRLKFLNSCPSSIAGSDGWASKINSKYGRVRSF